METNNYKSLLLGTLLAALVLLLTGYLYYNIINEAPADGSDWGYKILYCLVLGFALSYLCGKSSRIGKSNLMTGLVIGLMAGIIILAASRLVFFNSDETIICCQGKDCWFLILQIMAATAAAASAPGRTGSGGDDK